MKALLRPFAILSLLVLASGCAGGWRGGAAPAEWAAGGSAPSSPGTAAVAANHPGGTHATAQGITFVWTGEGGAVNVAGDFNAWSTSADPLVKDANGHWTLEKQLAPGKYAYKFVIDGSNWKPDPSVSEGVDDTFGGKNSVVVVGGGAAASAPAAAMSPKPAAPAAKAGGPTVTADGAVFHYSGPGGSVNLAGEFNAWSTSADPLAKGTDGVWSITKKLAPGKYAYKFVIDGTSWKEDPNAAETADDGYGGKNSLVTVGGAAGAAAATTATTATPAAPAPAKAPGPGAKPLAPAAGPNGVTFTFAGVAKTGVALCGDFNAWATSTDPMTQQADGTWTITRKLAPGTYAYKYLVDGSSWKTDDGNPATRDDGLGGKNSVLIVK